MTVNAQNVLVGAPDQLATGAVRRAPLGTALPATAVIALNAAFTGFDPGYVDEGGLIVSPSRSTQPIRDWSRAVVRRVLDSWDGTVSYQHLEMSEDAMKIFAGDDQVAVAAADGVHGTQRAMKLGAFELPHYSWVFNMKDGLARARVVLPDANVTTQGDLTFVANGAIKLPVTLSAYPDASGVSVYIYTDDGVLTA